MSVSPLLWSPAWAQGQAQPGPLASPKSPPDVISSSAVITEVALEDPVNPDAKSYFDLDTGKTFKHGESSPEDYVASRRWLREHGADLMSETRFPTNGFAAYDLLLVPTQGRIEDYNDYNALANDLRNDPQPFDLLNLTAGTPKLYLFRTREGAIGVLEAKLVEGAQGLQLRFKVIPKPAPPPIVARGRRGGAAVARGQAVPGRGAPPLAAAAVGRGGRRGAPSNPTTIQQLMAQQIADQQLQLEILEEQRLRELVQLHGEGHPSVLEARRRVEVLNQLSRPRQETDADSLLRELRRRQLDLEISLRISEASTNRIKEQLRQIENDMATIQSKRAGAVPATRPANGL